MKKSTLLMIVSVVLAMTLSLGGTLAYLQDSDADVNVMILGNVQIEQHEYERDANGELTTFTDAQTVYPAVYLDGSGATATLELNGHTMNVRDKNIVKNYVDKIVTVENTGKSEAYVRTIFAFPEAGEFNTTYDASEQWLHWNGASDGDNTANPSNGWVWGTETYYNGKVAGNITGGYDYSWPGNYDGWYVVENVTIAGKVYDLYVATNINKIAPETETAPNLLGFFLDCRVSNEIDDDGNVNYTWTDKTGKVWNLGDISQIEILVATQAVQVEGFADAWTALEEGFGNVTKDSHPWLDMDNIEDGDQDPDDVVIPNYAHDVATLVEALESNADFKLANDITITDWTPVASFSGTFDGNGHTITFDLESDENVALIKTATNATIKNLTFEGEIKGGNYAAAAAVIMDGGLVENCVNNAAISAGRAAGLVAWIDVETEIKDCVNTGDITGEIGAAGIANRFFGTMTNCKNDGDILAKGTEPAGGLVSVLTGASTFDHCVNTGDVTSEADNPNASAAGILGHSPNGVPTMNYCANFGQIIADKSYASGIVYTLYGNANSNYCYNAGFVSGADGAGGISAKAQYGANDKAANSLNGGMVYSPAKTLQIANKPTNSFYYANGTLYATDGTAVTNDDALAILNGGSDTDFFAVSNGVITVK